MPRQAADAADVLEHSELAEIRVYELMGRRHSEAQRSIDSAEDFQVRAVGDTQHFETHARLTLITDEAEILADVAAIHVFTEELLISREVAAEFTQRVGIMSVYPFVREHIFTTASRLGVTAPVLGMLRAGQFNIQMSEEPSSGG